MSIEACCSDVACVLFFDGEDFLFDEAGGPSADGSTFGFGLGRFRMVQHSFSSACKDGEEGRVVSRVVRLLRLHRVPV